MISYDIFTARYFRFYIRIQLDAMDVINNQVEKLGKNVLHY